MTKSVVHLQQNLNLKLRVWSLNKVILYLKPVVPSISVKPFSDVGLNSLSK